MTLRFAVTAMLLSALAIGAAHAAAPELRALQVHHWIDGGRSKEQIDETVKWAKDANFNIIQFQVRRVGDAYYDSAYEPRATNILGDDDFDPLGYMVKKAHENGIQVYAWVNACRIWASESKPADPKHIVNLHPEWLSKNSKGEIRDARDTYLDVGAPGARKNLVNIIADIVTKYDVDGIMLDYIRFPSPSYGYNDTSVAGFNKKYNRTGKPKEDDPQWCQWRRDQVTATVKAIQKEINRLKPWVTLCAATIVWGASSSEFENTAAYAQCFQDWRLWTEKGLLDVNMPMNYKDPAKPDHAEMYTGWLNAMKKWEYDRMAANTVMVWNGNVDGAIKQTQEARAKGLGTVGFAVSQNVGGKEFGVKIRERVFKEPAPVPVLHWKKPRPSEPGK